MPSSRVRGAALLLAPALLFGVLHLHTLDYGFVWTDHDEIEEGSVIRPPGHILAAFGEPLHVVEDVRTRHLAQPYYRPLQVVTASLLDAHFGRTPRTFRAAALALGAITVMLFAALCWTLSGSAGVGVLAGAIVAVHPVGLETYVWISGLSAALVGLLLVASLFLAVRAMQAESAAVRVVLGVASGVTLAFGLLSKENAAIAPAWLLAIWLANAAARRSPGRDEAPTALNGRVATVLLLGWTALVLATFLGLRPLVLGTSLSGVAPIGGSGFTQVATALAHWPVALAWLALPWQSNTSDAVRVVTTALDPLALLGLVLALASLAAWLWLMATGRALAAIGLAWLWLAFLPTSGLVPLLHVGAERNLFLSVFGAALLWAAAGRALRRRGAPAALVTALGITLVLGLAWRTFARAPDWRSTTALFERDVAADPRHREGRYNLIPELGNSGRLDEAKHHADVLMAQRGETAWSSYLLEERVFEIHCEVNAAIGRDPDTIARYDAEIRREPPRAHHMPAYHSCAAGALERAGRVPEALAIFGQLERMTPSTLDAPFRVALARCHAKLGHRREAREWLARVPRGMGLDPAIARVEQLLRAPDPDVAPDAAQPVPGP